MRVGMIEREAPEYRAGKPSAVPLTRENVVHGMLAVVRASFGVTGGTGVGTIHADANERLLRNYTLKANGNAFQSFDGRFLFYLYQLTSNGGGYPQVAPTSLAAASSEDIVARYFLPFGMPWSHTPHDFALPTTVVGSPTAVFTFGDAEDMAAGNDGALALSDVSVELYEQPLYGASLPARLFQGMQVATYQKELTQSGNLKIRLEEILPGMQIRGVLILPDSGGSGGDDFEADASVVDYARLVIDGKAEWDRTPFSELQARNVETYGLAAELPVAFIDAAEDKNTRGAGELWTVSSQQKPVVELECTKQAGENRVTVYVIFSDPLIGRR